MSNETFEPKDLDKIPKPPSESDEGFAQRRAVQKKIIEDLPDDFLAKIGEKLDVRPGETVEGNVAGALFEYLVEVEHSMELDKVIELSERNDLEQEMLDFFKFKAESTLRRPDVIDIRESETGGKLEIVSIVEATASKLGRRKYLQLRDFAYDIETFLTSTTQSELFALGYKNFARELSRISLSPDLKYSIYMTADKNLNNVHEFTDGDGFSDEEWDEFVEDILPQVELKRSVFNSTEIAVMTKTLAPHFKK